MTKLRVVYEDLGKSELFEALHEFIAWNGAEGGYGEAAAKLGISEGTAGEARPRRLNAPEAVHT